MNTVSKINLSNLKKCNQIWSDMPKSEKGRICLKCNNTIIDFRNLTDPEVAQTHVFSEQKVCGLYNKKQLKKPKKAKHHLMFNGFNSLYLSLFSFLTFNCLGQENIETHKTEQTERKYSQTPIKEKINIQPSILVDSLFISGKLTDKNEEPLPFANISIKGTKTGITSDIDGFYKLNITEKLDTIHKIVLRYSYIGFHTVEKEIDTSFFQEEKNKTINLKLIEAEIVEFVVYERAPFYKRIWYKLKNIFRRKDNF